MINSDATQNDGRGKKMVFFKSWQQHLIDIENLQNNFLKNKNKAKPFALGKSILESNSIRNKSYKKYTTSLNLHHLKDVIELNSDEKYIIVEPGITMQQLCEATLAFGLVPPIVSEFSTITVGGAIMGAAIESSSHLYGQFNDCCEEYLLLLGSGKLLLANREENSDLFYGISGSYGTLGLLLRVKIKLIKAESHVLLNYAPFSTMHEALNEIKKQISCPACPLYIEGLIIAPDRYVVITASFLNLENQSKSYPIFAQKRWNNWYYNHIEKITRFPCPLPEIMTIRDYLFRFDRGAFWMGRFILNPLILLRIFLKKNLTSLADKIHQGAFPLKPEKGPSLLLRWLFNSRLTSKYLYHLWHSVPAHISENLFFVQDFYIPFPQVEPALTHCLEQTSIYPIWLCPVKNTKTPQLFSPHFVQDQANFSHFLNVGMYGIPRCSISIPQLTEQLEKALFQWGGRKMLYSFTYYNKEFFSKIYELEYYYFLRKKYEAEDCFLSLYQKIVNN